MATIEKRTHRNGVTYRAKVRLDGHPTASRSFSSKSAARAWASEVEAEMRNGKYAAGSGRTLTEAIEAYECDRLLELRDQTTTRGHLNWWRSRLGAMRLRELSVMAIADSLSQLSKESVKPRKQGGVRKARSAATLNRYKATLSAVLKWCQRHGWIADNPARYVAAKVENNERVRFLTSDERLALLSACKASPSPALHPAVVTLLATGARLMEVMTLRWSDVDLQGSFITIRTSKNGDARRVPLPADAVAVLRAWAGRGNIVRLPSALVFPATSDPKKPADLRRSWHTALKIAKIANFRRHDLRHSAASALASGGASLLTIGAVLGHRSAAATKRYAHLAENDLRDAIERAAAKHRVS